MGQWANGHSVRSVRFGGQGYWAGILGRGLGGSGISGVAWLQIPAEPPWRMVDGAWQQMQPHCHPPPFTATHCRPVVLMSGSDLCLPRWLRPLMPLISVRSLPCGCQPANCDLPRFWHVSGTLVGGCCWLWRRHVSGKQPGDHCEWQAKRLAKQSGRLREQAEGAGHSGEGESRVRPPMSSCSSHQYAINGASMGPSMGHEVTVEQPPITRMATGPTWTIITQPWLNFAVKQLAKTLSFLNWYYSLLFIQFIPFIIIWYHFINYYYWQVIHYM